MMQEFVCQKNIAHFRTLLEKRANEPQRPQIVSLLAAEEAKLKQLTIEQHR